MIETLSSLTNIPIETLPIFIGSFLLAGLVRGFSGFALSAVGMACLVVFMAPAELIPICFVLEGIAGIIMLRGGMKDADMTIVWALVVGSLVGNPIGLYLTKTVSPEVSKVAALGIILALTILQLFRVSPAFIGTKKGLYGTGLFAGIIGGLASVAGMVVALYVLASKKDAKSMRASLVMFLVLSLPASFIYLIWFGLLDAQAGMRSLVFAPVVLLGVFVGSLFFRPSLIAHYRKFCLLLLCALSLVGLSRLL